MLTAVMLSISEGLASLGPSLSLTDSLTESGHTKNRVGWVCKVIFVSNPIVVVLCYIVLGLWGGVVGWVVVLVCKVIFVSNPTFVELC